VQLEAGQLDGETSKGSGCSTASRIGVPTLPALIARSHGPQDRGEHLTVVVLPLVPVTVSQGAAPVPARIRQASSTSPQTGMPYAAASSEQRVVRRHPGEVTTRSNAGGAGHPGAGDGVRAEAEVGAEDVRIWARSSTMPSRRRAPAVDDESRGRRARAGRRRRRSR
jgi:hypothetical protein